MLLTLKGSLKLLLAALTSFKKKKIALNVIELSGARFGCCDMTDVGFKNTN